MKLVLIDNDKVVYEIELDGFENIYQRPPSPASTVSIPEREDENVLETEICEMILDTPCPPGKVPPKMLFNTCDGCCVENKKGITHRFPCVFRLAKIK